MRSPMPSARMCVLLGAIGVYAGFYSAAISRILPIGTVLSVIGDAANSRLRDTRQEGSAIYDGDILNTFDNKTIQVELNGPKMTLYPKSFAKVHAIWHGFTADLSDGTVVISTSKDQTFEIASDGVKIRPVQGAATNARIAWISDTKIVLGSEEGSLEVTLGKEVKTIESGKLYRLEIGEPEPGPQGQSTKPAGANHFNLIVIPAVAAITGIIVWRALVSPSAP